MKQIRTAHCNTLHSTFCSPFSSIELSTAISQLSTSTSSGPDQITYPLLSHLPQSALNFLLYIFNLSWSTHTFPSAWKQSTIIPILKPGKPSDSPSSYRPISLTSCTSKLFERMVLGRLIYFLEQQDILSPVQAGFRPGRSTVDQVLLLSQSIADSFHQSKPGARTVLATVDFAKAFDSVWHSALLSKLLSLDLPLCFVEWIRSYLSDRRSKVRICNSYSRPFCLRRGVPQGSVLGQVLFLYINNLPTFLPASVKTSLYADDLAIWASSPSVECATAVVQTALNRLVEWSSKWRLPLNPLKCETSFFSLDPYQSRIQPSLHILNTPLKFNPRSTFLGVTFDRTLSFKYHVLSLRKSFTADSVLSAPLPLPPGVHQKDPYVPYTKPLFAPILTYASPGWFPFSSPTHITSVERMHRSSCRVITGCLSSTPIPLLHIEALLPPLRVTLTHQSLSFFERALRLPPTFPIASLANSNPRTRLKKSSWRSFSRSHNLTPNLHLTREPLILCPPKPPWSAPSSYTISLHFSSPCSCKDPPPFATLQLPPIFPLYLTAISLPGLTVRYLAGWDRVVQGYTSSVQSVSLLPHFSSRLVSGLPVIVLKPSLSYVLLSGVSLTPRHVILNLSPSFPTLYLSCQLSLPPLLYLTPKSLSNTQSLLNSLSQSKVVHLQ